MAEDPAGTGTRFREAGQSAYTELKGWLGRKESGAFRAGSGSLLKEMIPLRTAFLRPLLGLTLSAGLLVAAPGCTGEAESPTVTLPGSTATPPASGEPDLALRTELDRYAAETGVTLSVAVYEYGSNDTWSYNPQGRYLEASLVKVPILLTLLRQATEEERELTETESLLAELMIGHSDNTATDELYSDIGGAEELQRTYGLLGIGETAASDIWGANETTAGDQLRIATAVALGVDWIRPDLREYAAGLLENVAPDQTWGVTAGILNPAVQVGLKNGWLQDDLLAWNVGSSGFVIGGTTEYSIVVLTTGTETLEEGISVVEGAAAIINRWELEK